MTTVHAMLFYETPSGKARFKHRGILPTRRLLGVTARGEATFAYQRGAREDNNFTNGC
jgi:hypothetical protein